MFWGLSFTLALIAAGYWLWQSQRETQKHNTLPSAPEAPRPQAVQAAPASAPDTDEARARDAQEEAAEMAAALNERQRNESREHGLIIFRWLRNVKFNDKSVKEVLEAGTEDDRKELRGIVSHVVSLYEGIMSNARAQTPGLAARESVRAADRAAQILQHAIKILVALEKPTHMAQASVSIGADVTQQPDRWNELQNQTVDRLMQALKGALEDAFGAMQQQAADHDRAQEEATEQSADALEAADQQRRRRRRRRRQQSTQAKAFEKRRNAGDMNGDGVADSLQGLNLRNVRDPIRIAPPALALSAQDQAALASIRSALMQGSTGLSATQNLASPEQTLSLDGKVKDDKTGGGGLSGLKITDTNPSEITSGLDGEDAAQRIIRQRERDTQMGKNGKQQPKI